MTMKAILEYLLTKKKPHEDPKRQRLIEKLHKDFGDLDEFKNIIKYGTFYCLSDETSVKKVFPDEVIELAETEKTSSKMELNKYTWSIDDIIDYFKHDYDKTYDAIRYDWFDYLIY